MHPLRKAILTNQCLYCMHTFSTTKQARVHLQWRIGSGHCPIPPQARVYNVQPVDQVRCPFCLQEFPTLDDYYIHIRLQPSPGDCVSG
eukprot:7698199-Heterocapsa_arctica.AAC.1